MFRYPWPTLAMGSVSACEGVPGPCLVMTWHIIPMTWFQTPLFTSNQCWVRSNFLDLWLVISNHGWTQKMVLESVKNYKLDYGPTFLCLFTTKYLFLKTDIMQKKYFLKCKISNTLVADPPNFKIVTWLILIHISNFNINNYLTTLSMLQFLLKLTMIPFLPMTQVW